MTAEPRHRTFRDVLVALGASADLPVAARRHLVCSLNCTARALCRQPEELSARWIDVRELVIRIHPVRVGWTGKTAANHKANVRRALAWYQRGAPMPLRGMSLIPEWACLWRLVLSQWTRERLSALVRFLSLERIPPNDVDEAVLDRFMAYRAENTRLAYGLAARRRVARAWNECADRILGWPQRRMSVPPDVRFLGARWDMFPESLQAEIDGYLRGLKKPRKLRDGRRARPSSQSTIATRRRELIAFVRKAVSVGIPLDALISLSALLAPATVERVLQAYWDKNGKTPKTYTIDLPWRLYVVARDTGSLDEVALEQLAELRATMEQHRGYGLTPKNRGLLRIIKTTKLWDDVVALPAQLMAEARRERRTCPVRAAVKAQIAAGTAILTFAPVRIGNLVSTRLDEHLYRPGGPSSRFWLNYPAQMVKNRVDLEFPFDEELTDIVSEYVDSHRSVLLRGFNERWLFCGENGGHKSKQLLSLQISTTLLNRLGVRVTAQQFRHVAGAVLLKRFPGNYELVAKVLGHRSTRTTMRAYIGLETLEANEIFAKLVRGDLRFNPEE